MTTIVTPKAARAKEVEKDASMVKQKEMMAAHYDKLTSAQANGAKADEGSFLRLIAITARSPGALRASRSANRGCCVSLCKT